MGVVESQRTLVKSIPELWAELSETALLGRMLAEPFGEIRITRRNPESTLEWEGEQAAGSIELLPSGFGTRVRLTAWIVEPEPPSPPQPPQPATRGLLARLLARLRGRDDGVVEPVAEPPRTIDTAAAQDALTSVLDEIGAARHRPFSRQS